MKPQDHHEHGMPSGMQTKDKKIECYIPGDWTAAVWNGRRVVLTEADAPLCWEPNKFYKISMSKKGDYYE